jgi:hypothetical protein
VRRLSAAPLASGRPFNAFDGAAAVQRSTAARSAEAGALSTQADTTQASAIIAGPNG